ncbi:MAG: hypothetical protein JJE49_00215 [Peptostreptococcaceae bacterium]|nr:hypothetical protein [Peptostreptococcaceae bacterium]
MKKSIDKNIIENIKSVILVVLIISTILLLYFFWGDISLEDLKLSDSQANYETMDIKDLIVPSQIIISLGEDSYKLATKDKWSEMVKGLDEFMQSDTLIVEEITKDQYEKVMKISSIRAKFNYQLSLSEFCLAYGIKTTPAFDDIGTISEIGYGKISKESLLIYDSKKMKYYRIIITNDAKRLEQLLTSLMEEESPIYYTIGKYLGGGVTNTTFIPITLQTNLHDFDYNREVYSKQNDAVSTIAQSYFGQTFDFIRKIEDGNGTVIYMYGYGQKVLIVNTNGVIEYKEESTGTNSEVGYLESLRTALNFIGAHGAFEGSDGSKYEPYLKNVGINLNGKRGYRFTFGLEVNDYRIYYQDRDPIIVEITENQVTYFNRDLSEYNNVTVEEKKDEYKEAYSAINMLAENYSYFKNEMGMTGTFEEIANRIISVEPGYAVVRKEGQMKGTAKAAWIVGFDGMEAYFDVYTTNPLGFKIID